MVSCYHLLPIVFCITTLINLLVDFSGMFGKSCHKTRKIDDNSLYKKFDELFDVFLNCDFGGL